MADTLFTLLEMEPVNDFRAVLQRYIEKTNPHSQIWWRHPVPETIQLHFCVANTPQKLHDYYSHLEAGTLDAWFVHHPVPKTLAEGAGEMLTWVRAKTLLHRMDRERLLQPLESAPVAEDAAIRKPLVSPYRPRFMPEGRRLPTRRGSALPQEDASFRPGATSS